MGYHKNHLTLLQSGFRMSLRIDEFSSFVQSKAHYYSDTVNVHETEWGILIDLSRYDPKSKKYELTRESPPHSAEPKSVFIPFHQKNKIAI